LLTPEQKVLTARYELELYTRLRFILVFNRFPPLTARRFYQKDKRETPANILQAILFRRSGSIGSKTTVVWVERCVARSARHRSVSRCSLAHARGTEV